MVNLKPLINTLLKQLEVLSRTLEERGYLGWYIKEVSKLRSVISDARTPHVPSRALWNKYTLILSAIEQATIVAKKSGYDFALHSIISSLREEIIEFKSELERAYLLERFQVSMPATLGIVFTILRTINNIHSINWLYYIISTMSVILVVVNPQFSLICTSILGATMILIEGDISSLLTGSLLLIVSTLYIYLLHMSKSSKFERRVEEIATSIHHLIEEELAPSSFEVGDAILSLVENYRVASTGVFAHLDREALLKYKAMLLLMTGSWQETTRFKLIKV